MKKWFSTYSLPVLTGLTLLVLPILYLITEGLDLRRLNPHDHIIQNGLTYGLFLIFSYVNHQYFITRLFLAKRYGRYVAVIIGCILGVALIPHRLEQWVFLKAPNDPTPIGWMAQLLWRENLFLNRTHQPDGYWLPRQRSSERPPKPPAGTLPLSVKLGIIILLSSVSTLSSISVQTNNRLRRLENEKLQAELQQLKAQIHPHFLFNTLNSIYALAIRKDERTADTIVKLAEFMRYMLRDADQNRVSLMKELDYLRNYIDLQRARLHNTVSIEFSIEGDSAGKQIAPLLLFTFIENAFKHGVNPDVESTIDIRVSIIEQAVSLHVFNRKVPISYIDDSNEVGLQNTQERLRLLYPDAHTLRIDDTPTDYTVDLTLNLS